MGGKLQKMRSILAKHVDLAKPNLSVYLSGVDFSVAFFLGWCIANSGSHLRVRQRVPCRFYQGGVHCDVRVPCVSSPPCACRLSSGRAGSSSSCGLVVLRLGVSGTARTWRPFCLICVGAVAGLC